MKHRIQIKAIQDSAMGAKLVHFGCDDCPITLDLKMADHTVFSRHAKDSTRQAEVPAPAAMMCAG